MPRHQVRQMQPLSLAPAPMAIRKEDLVLPERYVEPTWAGDIVREWARNDDLRAIGAYPTQSILLRGPSGVGKSTAARWLAGKLSLPLFSMCLSRTIDSYMGSTGKNIEAGLQYGMDQRIVLLIDEVDAVAASRIAKHSDVGEIWRITNTFIQCLDRWHATPQGSLLVATTNMADGDIDASIQRRFELQVEMTLPTSKELSRIAGVVWPEEHRVSHAVCRRMVLQAKRRSVLDGVNYELTLGAMISSEIQNASGDLPF